MVRCERCWRLSYGRMKDYHEHILNNKCTPKDVAGVNATKCEHCGEKTVHQFEKVCTNPACKKFMGRKNKLYEKKETKSVGNRSGTK